ncbi:MAG TPA: MBL fold metallo-hydrolase [Fimbriimonadaceae bacterium]|nr:MBL fold metallo-hydrolase [Fimbriimonadaceae bacterium]
MAKAIILGSGTSNGVPMLGYRYPDSFLANPKNHRTRSSILFQGPTGNVLVDCTPEMRLQVTREGIHEIETVIITHTHADHVMGMDDLRSLCMLTGRPMPIYALPEHQPDIRRIFPYAFTPAPPGLVFPRFDLHAMPERLDAGGLTFVSFVVDHGATKVLGLRVNDLAYITDVSHVPAEAEAHLANLDVLVVDGLRYRPHPNHFNLEAALEFRDRIRPKMTYLTHLTHDFDHDVTEAELPSGVKLAFDGLHLTL